MSRDKCKWTLEEIEIFQKCLEEYDRRTFFDEALKRLPNKTKKQIVYRLSNTNQRIKSYNIQSDPIILKKLKHYIAESPNNLRDAFKKLAKEIGCKWETISYFYYTTNSNLNRNKIGKCFFIMGNNCMFVNGKNVDSSENKL